MMSKMVFETTGLQLYSMTYSRKNKYKSGYFIQQRSDEHKIL